MSLSDLGNLGEFVGAIAVIVSVLYLAYQIRQGARATRAEIYQGLTLAVAHELQATGRDPEATRIFITGQTRPEELAGFEVNQFRLLIVAVFMRFENTHYQHMRRTLDPAIWHRWDRQIRSYIARPGVRAWWLDSKGPFSDRFTVYIDQLMEEIEELPPGELTVWAPRSPRTSVPRAPTAR